MAKVANQLPALNHVGSDDRADSGDHSRAIIIWVGIENWRRRAPEVRDASLPL